MRTSILCLCAALFVLAQTALAQEVLTPQQQEQSDRVSKTLRCVVCQNQSIYDSNADLAEDMRRLVEKRVLAGDSDDEVRHYLQERYGDYVLMTPPVQTNTLVLWGGPGIMLLLAGAWFVLRTRKTDQAQSVQVLSEADKERVREALSEPEGKA